MRGTRWHWWIRARRDRAGLLAALVVTVAAGGQAHAADDCAQASGREQVACLAGLIDMARSTLDQIYGAVLAKLPADDPSDTRKGRAQLVKAETAWRAYVDANCAFVGAFQGGSNLWVTNFAARCELDETRKRIDFLRHPPASGD